MRCSEPIFDEDKNNRHNHSVGYVHRMSAAIRFEGYVCRPIARMFCMEGACVVQEGGCQTIRSLWTEVPSGVQKLFRDATRSFITR